MTSKLHITQMALCPLGESPIFSLESILITIEDEAAGPFIRIHGPAEEGVRVDISEIDLLIRALSDMKREAEAVSRTTEYMRPVAPSSKV